VATSAQLFDTLCAVNAGGYEADVSASELTPIRAQIRAELDKVQGPASEALRTFYRDHEFGDLGATLSRYVSYGLVVGPPPLFEIYLSQDELPPDVLALEGFGEVLAKYYKEADLARLYARAEPAYKQQVRRLEPILAQITLQEAGYVRQILKPSREHTFTVYVEPLVGARSHFRNYGGRYALALDPSHEAITDEMRHSLLHFLLDGTALKNPPPIAGRKALLDVASRALGLPIELREDATALADECLVKAVELRIRRVPLAQATAALDQAETEGFLLIRPIYNGLTAYEKGEQSLNDYYGKLIGSLNLTAEAKRLENVKFTAEAAARPAADSAAHPAVVRVPVAQPSELERSLAEGERQLAAKDARAAAETFQKILEKHPNVPRAQYGLGVAVIVNGHVERGKELLEQVIQELTNAQAAPSAAAPGSDSAGDAAVTPASDPRTLAWAHVWLGRIYEETERRDLAEVEYRAALAVEGAPNAAKAAAQRGLSGAGPQGKPQP
jgi:tetratricopeptide (TPR) repeat protein